MYTNITIDSIISLTMIGTTRVASALFRRGLLLSVISITVTSVPGVIVVSVIRVILRSSTTRKIM